MTLHQPGGFMYRQHSLRTARFSFFTLFLIAGFLLVGCGSKRSTQMEDSEVSDLDDTPVENPVNAPVPIPLPIPSTEPVPIPSSSPPPSQWNQLPMDQSFGQFNQIMRRCRPNMGRKDKLIKWLLALLEGTTWGQSSMGSYNQGIPTIYYDSRGFQPSSRGGACMKGLKKRLNRFRDWEDEGYFDQGTMSNWVEQSADWTYGYNGSYGNNYGGGSQYGNGSQYGYPMGQ